MTITLTDSQLVILSAAANHKDRTVLPLPSTLTFNKASATRVINSLVSKGLVEETEAGRHTETWRKADDGTALTLLITDDGLRAIGIDPEEPATPSTGKTAKHHVPAPTATPSGSKLKALVTLMQRPDGATSAEMMGATGWQAHSIRGAISGALKKKLGLTILSELQNRGRVYRILPVKEAA